MILPWPLTTSAELAQVLRPGGQLRPDSALRTLRDNGLAAEPISIVPRSTRGAHGRLVWYSSLMIDVARLFRVGDEATAAVLCKEATNLASNRASHFVAEHLVGAGEEPDTEVLDAETGGALTRLGLLTAAIRQDHQGELGVETFLGRVADTSGSGSVVVAEDGRELAIPASTIPTVGTLVTVDTEVVPGGTAVWVRRAFESETDPHQRVPGGPHLLTPAERERLRRPVSSAR